ncbi:MAG: hypothetical protein ACRDPY_06515 [Streptosporangiaceae bacterium]
MALPYPGINLTQIGPFWTRAHTLTAEVTLGLVPVHVAEIEAGVIAAVVVLDIARRRLRRFLRARRLQARDGRPR